MMFLFKIRKTIFTFLDTSTHLNMEDLSRNLEEESHSTGSTGKMTHSRAISCANDMALASAIPSVNTLPQEKIKHQMPAQMCKDHASK